MPADLIYSVADMLEVVEESYQTEIYDSAYQGMLMMAGDLEQAAGSSSAGAEAFPLPEYQPIVAKMDPSAGLQNHALVAARLSVMSVVYSDPDIQLIHPDNTFREVNRVFLRQRWYQGDWSSKLFQAGMEVEACGRAFLEVGLDEEGKVNIEHVSSIDVMFDAMAQSPADADWYLIRKRVSRIRAIQKYGGVIPIDRLNQLLSTLDNTSALGSGRGSKRPIKMLYEYSFWSDQCHYVVLGSWTGEREILVMEFSEEDGGKAGAYRRVEVPDEVDENEFYASVIGTNPFGGIPIFGWIDSWNPGAAVPQGRIQSIWRLVVLLAFIEAAMEEVVTKDLPVTLLSTVGMRPATIDKLEKYKQSMADLGGLLLTDMEDPEKSVARIAAGQIPDSWIQMRSLLLQEINAATGNTEQKRGNSLPGNATAYEVRVLLDQSSIQSRHQRKRYASMLERMLKFARKVAAQWDTKSEILVLSDTAFHMDDIQGTFGTFRDLIGTPVELAITEASLSYKSDEQKMAERIQQFQIVDMQAIGAAVVDPIQLFNDVYRDLGIRDPHWMLSEQIEQMPDDSNETPPEIEGLMQSVLNNPSQPGAA